ncbi:MAG: hypothetical protein FWE85_00245 [Clostridiales bacterium]|nr:hypothetical protein [Clostridiales bacterium]
MIFKILLITGLAVPLLSLVLSLFSDILEGLFDLLDLDLDFGLQLGGMQISLLPASPTVWCAMFVVTGALGMALESGGALPVWLIWLIALPAGYITSLIINKFIYLPMKRAKSLAQSVSEFLGMTVEVNEPISAGGVGSVVAHSKSGIISYAASSVDGKALPQGSKAMVIRFEGGRLWVEGLSPEGELDVL